jgi:hypothetical protein
MPERHNSRLPFVTKGAAAAVDFARRENSVGLARSEAGGKLQFRVNAEQRAARWDFRTEIADEPVPRADLDMTDAARGAVHEHRTDRRGEWIRH